MTTTILPSLRRRKARGIRRNLMSTDVTTEELWSRDCSVLCSCSRRPTGGEEERRRG